MAPYYPSTTQACFEYNKIAHHHGIITSEQYLDHMIAHLGGARHPEDKSAIDHLYDPLTMVFYACTRRLDTVIIEDTSSIKRLVLDAWLGETESVMIQTPLVLASLELYGISTDIYEGLLCIACMSGRIELLKYFLSLDVYLMRLAGSDVEALQHAISRAHPDVALWSILLEKGLYLHERGSKFDPSYSPPTNGIYPESYFNSWAERTLSIKLPTTELLEFLIARGFVITQHFFHTAVSTMNPVFVRWLLTKCDPGFLTGRTLFFAAFNSPQMVDMILDTGVDVNVRGPEGVRDPFRPIPGFDTPLHQAADGGKADIVRLLLERGADKSLKNSWDQTADRMAANQFRPYPEIVDLILNFVPGPERYVLPQEVGEELLAPPSPGEMSKGKYWKFIENVENAKV